MAYRLFIHIDDGDSLEEEHIGYYHNYDNAKERFDNEIVDFDKNNLTTARDGSLYYPYNRNEVLCLEVMYFEDIKGGE